MAVPDVVEPRPVSVEVSEQPPLLATKVGDATDRADFSQIVGIATLSCRLKLVDKRNAVVLYIANNEVQPTREYVSTVAVVNQVTGRVTIDLIDNGEHAEVWRREINGTIPVGALDERMARALTLLAEGPPRNSEEILSAHRTRDVRAQLAQGRSRGAGTAARLQRKIRLAAGSTVQDVLQEVADGPAGDQAEFRGRAEVAATRPQQRCCGELGLHVEISVPTPESPARPSYVMGALAAMVSLGVAVGVARIVHGLPMWIGIPTLAAQLVAPVVGLDVTAVAMGVTIRRNARQRTVRWWVNYLTYLRRRWTQSVEMTARKAIGTRGQGW